MEGGVDVSDFFSSNLKFLREKKGLSQSKLAKKIGVNQTTIARWEDDNRVPTIDNAVDVSKALNIPLEKLLGTDLSKESDFKIDDDIDVLLSAYKELSDSDKEFMKNMIIQRRNQMDKELRENEEA